MMNNRYFWMIVIFTGITLTLITSGLQEAECIDVTISTPSYRATPYVTAIAGSFNAMINTNIDNFDAVATAIAPAWPYWTPGAVNTPSNNHYSDSITTNVVIVYTDYTTADDGIFEASKIILNGQGYLEMIQDPTPTHESGLVFTTTDQLADQPRSYVTYGIDYGLHAASYEDVWVYQYVAEDQYRGLFITADSDVSLKYDTSDAENTARLTLDDTYAAMGVDSGVDLGQVRVGSGLAEMIVQIDVSPTPGSRGFTVKNSKIYMYSPGNSTGSHTVYWNSTTGELTYGTDPTPQPAPTLVPTQAPPTPQPVPTQVVKGNPSHGDMLTWDATGTPAYNPSINASTPVFNANKLRNTNVTTATPGANTLLYHSDSKIEYVTPVPTLSKDTAQWNANKLQGRTVPDITPTPGQVLSYQDLGMGAHGWIPTPFPATPTPYRVPLFTDDVSNPPLYCEIETVIDGEPTATGYQCIIDDNGAGETVWKVVVTGNGYAIFQGTPLPEPGYVVTLAGTTAANGCYVDAGGTADGVTAYEHEAGTYYLFRLDDRGTKYWCIGTNTTETDPSLVHYNYQTGGDSPYVGTYARQQGAAPDAVVSAH
jgi:hypothetical protein